MTPQTKLLFFAKSFVLLSCLRLGLPQDIEVERLKAEIQIDDLELVDACSNIAQAKKTAIVSQNFSQKIVEEESYGSLLKNHYNVLRKFVDIPIEIERSWTYQVKPGDSLLPEETWHKFVTYKNNIEALITVTKFNCTSDKCLIGKSDFNHALNMERDYNTLKLTWTNWENIFVNFQQFKLHLGYVKEAALLNEFDTVQSYWEALIDFSEGYQQADQFWEEISPFYKKLHSFVRTRLFKFYGNEEHKDDIPAFLLGGELGTDWSNIADVVLPHPQLHYDVQTYLKYKDVKEIYVYAEDLVTDLGLKRLGNQFWDHSIFNHTQCGPEFLEYCNAEYTAIVTCNQTSWSVYLHSLETALKVALNNFDYTSLPREHLRFCAIDDAVQKLGLILAISRLENDGIVASKSDDDEAFKMTKLLLVALRVMPRLAYTLMVDKWRLEALEQDSPDLAVSWWKYRKQYMGVEGINNTENEYLQDSKIISNQPYLSEFYGILMAFQLYAYHKEHAGDSDLIADFAQEDTFITLIKSRHSTDWPFLLSSHYGLDISATELLHYFEPLERYFETAPVEQEPLVTTTTTTTSTTTTTTTTIEPAVVKQDFGLDSEVVNDEPKVNSSSLDVNLESESVQDDHVPMYAGIGIMVALGSVLLAGLVYKTAKKRQRTNNRRFDP